MGQIKGARGQFTLESWMIANGKKGKVFYSEKLDRHLTAIATGHKRKIRTERLITVTSHKEKPVAGVLTRVTLL